ncbi:hypothetical protein [Bradyrhizobium sp. Gha]|uniref:hypothetical protein n=1 Tax=Bradyrhizobium sp. Gha TaxID=1855318 RepID=UPI001160A77C|nr:hypothetical protein [Bradyrhizobium sp. Gha]
MSIYDGTTTALSRILQFALLNMCACPCGIRHEVALRSAIFNGEHNGRTTAMVEWRSALLFGLMPLLVESRRFLTWNFAVSRGAPA